MKRMKTSYINIRKRKNMTKNKILVIIIIKDTIKKQHEVQNTY